MVVALAWVSWTGLKRERGGGRGRHRSFGWKSLLEAEYRGRLLLGGVWCCLVVVQRFGCAMCAV